MSTPAVHATAVVADSAELGAGCVVGPFTVIEDGVRVGAGSRIASHVVLHTGTRLGDRVRVGPHTVLGGDPQSLGFDGAPTGLVVGDDTVIHEAVTVHRATGPDPTSIGPGCLIMGQVHIAHDCVVAASAVVAQGTMLAGHVRLGEWSVVGGMTGLHQWVRVGPHAFVGGMAKVLHDVLPFTVADGFPARHRQINAARLRRRGFPPAEIRALRAALASLRAGGTIDRDGPDVVRTGEQSKGTAWPSVATFADFVDGPSRRGLSPL
jgi:UDP-N-acetylglucosamine acyltransferase